MSLKVKTKTEVEFPPIPEGTYTAICYTIADCGMQYNEKYKKTSPKIVFIWELVDDALRIEIDGQMKRRAISKQYTASFAAKSNMYKDLRPWLGREFTAEETAGTFDVGCFIGKGCILSIINETTGEGKVYSGISSIMQLPKGVEVGKPENPIVLYDIDESPDEDFQKLPEWVQEKIKKAKNSIPVAANSVNVSFNPETGEVIQENSSEADDLP